MGMLCFAGQATAYSNLEEGIDSDDDDGDHHHHQPSAAKPPVCYIDIHLEKLQFYPRVSVGFRTHVISDLNVFRLSNIERVDILKRSASSRFGSEYIQIRTRVLKLNIEPKL